MTKESYLRYIDHTLVPDLYDSGRDFMANDFADLAYLVEYPDATRAPKDGRSASEFIHYLKSTLIPDLKASGDKGLAKDFTDGMKHLGRKHKHGGKTTLATAKKELAALGMSLRKSEGEYRVTFRGVKPGRAEDVAHYTDDIDDAVATGRSMSKERSKV